MKNESLSGAAQIWTERQRQKQELGFSQERDAKYTNNELSRAAVAYCIPKTGWTYRADWWPWDEDSFKPSPEDRIRELVKAGALIAAEIDRLKSIKPEKAALTANAMIKERGE